MKEQNKYYIPELHEFHIGFRYEELINNEWVKTEVRERMPQIDISDIWSKIRQVSMNGFGGSIIRVKHLDRSDIEELGWNFEKTVMGYHYFSNDSCRLTLSEDELNVMISMRGVPFYFEIKNYNELKILMNQLNIK